MRVEPVEIEEELAEQIIKQEAPTPTVAFDNGPQIAALAQEVASLRETINILISQIQGLRSEVGKATNNGGGLKK